MGVGFCDEWKRALRQCKRAGVRRCHVAFDFLGQYVAI